MFFVLGLDGMYRYVCEQVHVKGVGGPRNFPYDCCLQ